MPLQKKGMNLYLEVRRLRKKGFTDREIADKTGLHINQVNRYLRNKTGCPGGGSIPAGTVIRLPKYSQTLAKKEAKKPTGEK